MYNQVVNLKNIVVVFPFSSSDIAILFRHGYNNIQSVYGIREKQKFYHTYGTDIFRPIQHKDVQM